MRRDLTLPAQMEHIHQHVYAVGRVGIERLDSLLGRLFLLGGRVGVVDYSPVHLEILLTLFILELMSALQRQIALLNNGLCRSRHLCKSTRDGAEIATDSF